MTNTNDDLAGKTESALAGNSKYDVKLSGKRTVWMLILMSLAIPAMLFGLVMGFLLCLTIIGAIIGIPMMAGSVGLPAMVLVWYGAPVQRANQQRKIDAELATIHLAGKTEGAN